jgi:hypothetical protein
MRGRSATMAEPASGRRAAARERAGQRAVGGRQLLGAVGSGLSREGWAATTPGRPALASYLRMPSLRMSSA